MTPRERRIREQAERRRLILSSARELAEAEGWDAVTTRRLADRIEYSQPVLYQHFKSKDAIIHAVALEGFAELARELRTARLAATDPHTALREVACAYVAFAARSPVLYQAMFNPTNGADPTVDRKPVPPEHTAAIGELNHAVQPLAGARDPDLLTEVLWSSFHGLASLTWGERLRPGLGEERVTALADGFIALTTSAVTAVNAAAPQNTPAPATPAPA